MARNKINPAVLTVLQAITKEESRYSEGRGYGSVTELEMVEDAIMLLARIYFPQHYQDAPELLRTRIETAYSLDF